MTDSLRVCHVINSLGYGGAETMLVDLIDAMAADVTVVSLEAVDDLQSELKAAGATVKHLDESVRFDPRTILRLRRLFRDGSFDIVHAHLPYAQTVSRLAARLAGHRPVVSTQHNVAPNYQWVIRTTERMTRPLDTKTVAVSQGVERSHTGRTHEPGDFNDDWCTIYNGIAVEAFSAAIEQADGERVRDDLDIDPSSTVFLNVGSYAPVKRQRTLVDAFARADTADAVLVLVGYGPLHDALEVDIEELGVSDRVHVTGKVPEVHPYYAIADVFATASQGEGMPVTLLEAMAAGLPIIASDIPGINEVVQDSETGALYPPDDIAELASLIATFEQRDVCPYARAARDRVTSFTIERMAESYRRLYAEVLV